MSLHQKKSLAIACASGSFKGAFTHGVLSALETVGIVANAIIKPDMDVKELGVDFSDATKEGFITAYQHGLDKGILVLN
jgi:hypothetical protein